MIRPVPSTIVAIIGPDTMAGSTRSVFSTGGSSAATNDDHSTMAATVTATVAVTCGPTFNVHARITAATAMVRPISAPVDTSLTRTAGRSRSRTWPVDIARTRVVQIWVPVLPPVPI